MRETSSRTLVGSVLALALAVATGAPGACPCAYAQQRSAADIAQARELFNDGIDRREKGDIAGAIEKLRAAHALAATPITGLELGRTYLAAGRLVEARELFLAVGRLALAAQETARSADARASAAQLAEQTRGRIPRVTIRVTGAPSDAVTVTVDGHEVPSDALGTPRFVNPGEHAIVAAPASGAPASATVHMQEGESRDVELHVIPAAAPRTQAGPSGAALPDPTTPGPPAAGSRALVYGGLGLAATGIAVGAVTGLLAMGKASSVHDACRNGLSCPRSIEDDLQTGRTMGNVSTILVRRGGRRRRRSSPRAARRAQEEDSGIGGTGNLARALAGARRRRDPRRRALLMPCERERR